MKIIIVLFMLGCGSGGSPTPTETVCPSPDPMTETYENFGMQFMETYCIQCHDSALPRSQRNGAPLFHDFDTLEFTLRVANHIDEQAGSGPAASNQFMPPERCPAESGGPLAIDCPQPTEEERQKLAEWMACEPDRPHSF